MVKKLDESVKESRTFSMTRAHAEEHLRAKGYAPKTGPIGAQDKYGTPVWFYTWERPKDKRKAFLWVFDPAEVYILLRVGRDGEGL
jgi:hypothetical protein